MDKCYEIEMYDTGDNQQYFWRADQIKDFMEDLAPKLKINSLRFYSHPDVGGNGAYLVFCDLTEEQVVYLTLRKLSTELQLREYDVSEEAVIAEFNKIEFSEEGMGNEGERMELSSYEDVLETLENNKGPFDE